MRTITYDSVSLSSGNYTVKTIAHENMTEREVYLYNLTREPGAEYVSDYYPPKKIIVEGIIKGTDIDTLETNIDSFKQTMSGVKKNLDIEYASGTRRYTAIARIVQIERDFYNLTYAPYSVEFIIPEGFGKDTAVTSYSTISIVAHTIEDESLYIYGTAIPKYSIEIVFNSATSVTGLSVTINGDRIVVNEAISYGQTLIIDAENKIVTLDGTSKDYTGLFPRLQLGTNKYKIITTSASHAYDVTVKYTKKYL